MTKEVLKLTDIMSMYGFKFAKESDENELLFLNDENIICKIYDLSKFEFIYTNYQIFGFLSSGVFDDIMSIGLFTQSLNEFKDTVDKIKEAFGVKEDV